MTNAEPTSTDSTSIDSTTRDSTTLDSTTERAQTTEGHAPLIAVSEENLAALLRATTAGPEPAMPEPVETPVMEVKEAPALEEAVASVPEDVVEPSLALFTAAKEHRSEILRTAATPAPVEQPEYPAAPLPETAPIQVTLPKPQPAVPAAHLVAPAASRTRLVMGCGIGAVILVVGLILLWPKSHPAKTTAAVVAAPADNAPLKLLAEPLGSGLINVRWNAQSTAITQARDGRLVITEHAKAPRIMALDAGQLKIGHLTYPTSAESIQFDLEVNGSSGAVAKESILALSSPAIAAPQSAREQAASVKPQVIPQIPPQAEAPKAATAAPPIVQTPVEVAQAKPAKAREFVPPPTAQKKAQSAIIDAPPALANAPATPLGVNVPAALATLAPPPVAAPKQIQVESSLQAANLIKKVVPVYPVLARTAGIQGIVRFSALIGKDGKIQNLKFLSGPPPLVDAASDAVKRWIYRPTLLNGQPVEVITQINVNFTISGVGR